MKIQLEDFLMHYEEKGDGEPLVLLHGNGEDLGYFAGQMEYFRETYSLSAERLPLLWSSLAGICMIV